MSVFPNLSKLVHRIFSIPCPSAAAEREFSAVGQIANQRSSNLDSTIVNHILSLHSIENNKQKY